MPQFRLFSILAVSLCLFSSPAAAADAPAPFGIELGKPIDRSLLKMGSKSVSDDHVRFMLKRVPRPNKYFPSVFVDVTHDTFTVLSVSGGKFNDEEFPTSHYLPNVFRKLAEKYSTYENACDTANGHAQSLSGFHMYQFTDSAGKFHSDADKEWHGGLADDTYSISMFSKDHSNYAHIGYEIIKGSALYNRLVDREPRFKGDMDGL